ncbi:MAG: carboxypeptidase regulatory-like domain-containing protein [Gemmatimonadaceae bacterium]
MRPCSSAIAIALVILGPAGLGAQAMTGRVIDRTTNEAIAGVVVSAVDSSRRVIIARTVTDQANGYRLPIAEGMARLQFRRIGYAPMEVTLRDSVNGRIDVTLTRLPVHLPPVKSVVTALCAAEGDREAAMSLWEEARAGLLTAIVAREGKSAWISVLLYRHGYDGEQELPRLVQRVELAEAANAFVAGAKPEVLAQKGYLEMRGFSTGFHAPDDVVLVDESFSSTHCFSMAPVAAGDDSTVGLRFTPAKGRKVPEVQGTVWLRKNPLDLRSVEFTYVNITRALARANPGGSIEFRQMPNGITMLHQWRIRGAAIFAPTRASIRGGIVVRNGMPRRSTGGGGSRDPVATATETGALIELMQWPGADPYLARLGWATGVVRDKLTGRPLRNTIVRLDATPFAATTDSMGTFRMIDVLPGVYAPDIGAPALDFHDIAPPLEKPRRIVAGPNDLGFIDVEGPATLVKRACDDKDFDGRILAPPGLGNSALFGAFVDARNRVTTPGFRVEIRPAGLVAGSGPLVIKGKTDRIGRFRVCGVPIDGTVTIITDESRPQVGRAELTFNTGDALGGPYQIVRIQLKPNEPPPTP